MYDLRFLQIKYMAYDSADVTAVPSELKST